MFICENSTKEHIHKTLVLIWLTNGHNYLVSHNTKQESLYNHKHPSLYEPFMSYEKNNVLWIQHLGPYSQHFILLVNYEWAE
jgi:hypothetical protein